MTVDVYTRIECQWNKQLWALSIHETMLNVVINNLKMCFPGIQITRKEVNNNMKLIRRIDNLGDVIAVVAESATHFIGAKVGDADRADGANIYSYSKTHYHVIGEVYESKVEK